jgi:hypothetical protein
MTTDPAKTTFYRIRDARWERKDTFPWAMSFGPLEDMPFLLPGDFERIKPVWEAHSRKPGLYVEGGSKWPDLLGYGGGYPPFFVSERVLESLNAAHIEIARATEMPIADIQSRSKKLKGQPIRYFALEAPYGIETDYEASGVPVNASGRPITPLPKSVVWTLKVSSWSGADLVSAPNMWKRPTCSLICTEKVVELAKHDGWTNCFFKPMPAV